MIYPGDDYHLDEPSPPSSSGGRMILEIKTNCPDSKAAKQLIAYCKQAASLAEYENLLENINSADINTLITDPKDRNIFGDLDFKDKTRLLELLVYLHMESPRCIGVCVMAASLVNKTPEEIIAENHLYPSRTPDEKVQDFERYQRLYRLI